MKDETINIEELIPDDQNANKGTERGGELIYNSFQHYGAGRSILVDKDNRIIAGNKSTVGAKKAGIQKVRIIETDGSELIALKRTDVSLDDPDGRGMAIMDNRTAEVNMEIDIEVVQKHAEEQGIDIEEWGYDAPPSLDNMETGEGFELPSGDRAPFQQMTFTLADEQAEYIKNALADVKKTEEYKYMETMGNENGNGNALYLLITKALAEQYG